MARGGTGRSGALLAQAALIVFLATLALTAVVLGLAGLVTGGVTGIGQRLPFYVLATAVAFLGSVLTFETEFDSPRRVVSTATSVAGGTLLVVGLGGEGIAYVVQSPAEVAASSLLFYVLSAGLVALALGVLGFRYWDGLAGDGSRL